MKNPFRNIHSIPLRVESTNDEVFVVDLSTNKRFPCCPLCWEPFYQNDPDGSKFGCVSALCVNYRPEVWPHWSMQNGEPVLIRPEEPEGEWETDMDGRYTGRFIQ